MSSKINLQTCEYACKSSIFQDNQLIFCKKEPFYYDAILMDIHMPVLDGIETTKRLRTMGRADSRTIPIIAMTANAFSEDSRKSLQIGMNGHLSKPIQIQELLKMLNHCFNTETALP